MWYSNKFNVADKMSLKILRKSIKGWEKNGLEETKFPGCGKLVVSAKDMKNELYSKILLKNVRSLAIEPMTSKM